MSNKTLHENIFDDAQEYTFTDFMRDYGFDEEMWNNLSDEEKQEYSNEYDELIQGAKDTLSSEGGLYEAIKLNNARKRFQQINEYILNMNGEKHEAQEQPQDAQQQMPPQQDDTQLDPTIGVEAEPANDEVGLEGEPEDGTMTEPAMESDEVIDVDDLTQSQETTEYKLDGVDDKLTQLIDIVSKFSQALEDNDEKINDLKKEIEERNPTQQERLNIRSMNGSPYNVSPQDYWSEQNARNPQYNVIGDNDVDPDKEDEVFTITDDDINNFNKDEIEKSINNFPKNLEDYFA